jgi:hypothetical protein
MRFTVGTDRADTLPKLIYRPDEHSFDVQPRQEGGIASVLVNDVNLEHDESGRVLYAWGFCPLQRASITLQGPPPALSRTLFVTLDGEVVPGVSHRVNQNRWPAFINKSTGWVCLGDPDQQSAPVKGVEFAPTSIVALNGDQLVALWLRPLAP